VIESSLKRAGRDADSDPSGSLSPSGSICWPRVGSGSRCR